MTAQRTLKKGAKIHPKIWQCKVSDWTLQEIRAINKDPQWLIVNFVLLNRACIQLNLPEDIAIQVDCLVYTSQSGDTSIREAMHVQSISHWAPANIGPYSQATKVSLTGYNFNDPLHQAIGGMAA